MAPPSRCPPGPRPPRPRAHFRSPLYAYAVDRVTGANGRHGRPRGCDRRPVRSPRARADGTDLAPHALIGMYHVRPAPAIWRQPGAPRPLRTAAGSGAAGGRRAVSHRSPPPVSHRSPIDRSSKTGLPPRARAHTRLIFFSKQHPHNVRPTPAGAAARACGAPRNPSAPLRRVPRRALEAQYPGVTPIDLIDGCVDEWCV